MAKPQSTTDYLYVTLPWIIIILGVLGNTLCAVVVLRKPFRNENIGVYLLALAILDTVYLLSNPLFHAGITILFEVDLRALSHADCVISLYITLASRAMSAWILVVISVERMLALAIPHLAKSLNTKRQAIITTLGVVIVQGIIHTYCFKVTTLREFGEWEFCTVTKEYLRNATLIRIANFINYPLFPVVVMATSNSVLIYLLKQSHDMRHAHGGTNIHSTAIMVVTTCIAFIVLTLPVTIYTILFFARVETGSAYTYIIVYSLALLNHAINFLLYWVSGATFRNEVKVMLGSCCSKFFKSTGGRSEITPMNPTPSSQATNEGTARIGSDSSRPGDMEGQDIEMV